MNLVKELEGKLLERQRLVSREDEINHVLADGLVIEVNGIEEVDLYYGWKQKRWKCNRCLATQPHQFSAHHCLRCGKWCTYCRHCIQMGKIATCTKLLKWVGELSKVSHFTLSPLETALSSAQRQAADEWIENYRIGNQHLIHAVCGAGKTEIMFQVIHHMLSQGLRVCVAAPRTDVVLELYPRFCTAFPQVTVQAFYGGAEKSIGLADITIATTHQLYRFTKVFDHIIVDEADAFPYSIDDTLIQAVITSKKDNGCIHFVSATPNKRLPYDSETVLSKRFHGQPLPVPRFEKLIGYEKQLKKHRIPKKLQRWMTTCDQRNLPYLIFLPTIRQIEDFPGNMPRVHAEHPMRKERVIQLRNKEIQGLLTSTILERGITIENLQVAVVGAEKPIFTSQALIQIAGRVGRSSKFPAGDIVFFHHGISDAMVRAKQTIEGHNR
ncbi:DEAD/DEAH box helicase [Chryseomicrobium palamuruense]|uniref:DEAD/DEAH box helicase n=1 Tax=Chryseomicrobium palamuruense TaxID=682973 RepID=A0ABV8UQM0_9BACL